MSVECQVNVKSRSELDIGGRETCLNLLLYKIVLRTFEFIDTKGGASKIDRNDSTPNIHSTLVQITGPVRIFRIEIIVILSLKMLVTHQEPDSAKYLTRGIRLLSVWNILAQPLVPGPHAQLDSDTGEYKNY